MLKNFGSSIAFTPHSTSSRQDPKFLLTFLTSFLLLHAHLDFPAVNPLLKSGTGLPNAG